LQGLTNSLQRLPEGNLVLFQPPERDHAVKQRVCHRRGRSGRANTPSRSPPDEIVTPYPAG